MAGITSAEDRDRPGGGHEHEEPTMAAGRAAAPDRHCQSDDGDRVADVLAGRERHQGECPHRPMALREAGPSGEQRQADAGGLGMEVGTDDVLHRAPHRDPDRQHRCQRRAEPARPEQGAEEQERGRDEGRDGQRRGAG